MRHRVTLRAVPGGSFAAMTGSPDADDYDKLRRRIEADYAEALDIRYEHCLSLLRDHMPVEVKWTASGVT